LAHFAFIGGSADIYITYLGLSEQTFSYFFAFNATGMMAGAFVCGRVVRRFRSIPLITASFAGILTGALWLLFIRGPGPWGLTLPMTLMTFSYGFNRPLSHNLILEQVDRNVGAASSLLTFSFVIVGAFAMWLIALEWSDKIRIIGILGAGSSGLVLGFWLILMKTADRKRRQPTP